MLLKMDFFYKYDIVVGYFFCKLFIFNWFWTKNWFNFL